MSETKQHWSLGADNTGDITSWDNFRKFKAEVDEVMEGVHLVKRTSYKRERESLELCYSCA